VNKFVDLDTLYRKTVKRKSADILLNRDLIRYTSPEFAFRINPLFNFQYGSEQVSSTDAYVNTRGAQAIGRLGNKIAWSTSFRENQATFHTYERAKIDSLGVIPGQGHPKAFKEDGYDYASAEAYVSYSPSDLLNVQFGHGKNFIGDGYRSLLLSDNSFNYPFLKLTADVWRIKYMAMWAQFQEPNMETLYIRGNPKKWGAFHYLDYNVCKWLNIGFFEAIMWENADSLGYRGFDVQYANPVIFMRPVEYANGSPDNVLMGLNGKITVLPSVVLYGQMVIDEFVLENMKARDGWWGNKWGLLGGIKLFDVLLPKLDLQLEASRVRPYTYTHFGVMQNYGHYGQPLAHPLGANFTEAVGIVSYNWGRIFVQAKLSAARFGADSASYNYGGNIYKEYQSRVAEYGNTQHQGVESTLINHNYSVSYLINPVTNMNIALGVSMRSFSQSGASVHDDQFVYVAFRTSLKNLYFDF